MSVNEKTALRLALEGKDYFFCSQRCLEKFAADKQIPAAQATCCGTAVKTPFYRNKTIIVAVILFAASLLSYYFPLLEPFRKSLLEYLRIIWWAVLLGLLLGGIIEHYVPREYVSFIFARPRKRTIFYAVFLGFLMSACSHGILALSIELHKKGASNPAVVAFLLASPWANAAITVMLIGFFGLKALYLIVSAIIIAVITGLLFQIFERKNIIETNPNRTTRSEGFSLKKDFRQRLSQYRLTAASLKNDIKGIYAGAKALSDMVLWWILIGMGIASVAGAYIPTHIFHHYMGATFGGMLVVLLLATIIEVCSEGSAPMAFEIFKQTQALGNSFVFLMAGVATDYTEIGLIWQNLGRRTAILLPLVTVPQIILFGWIANLIF